MRILSTMMMMTYKTEFGQVGVASSGEGMYLITLPLYGHEIYVVAFTPESAVGKACEFWYHKRNLILEKI